LLVALRRVAPFSISPARHIFALVCYFITGARSGRFRSG
jgi:hypothetical protein